VCHQVPNELYNTVYILLCKIFVFFLRIFAVLILLSVELEESYFLMNFYADLIKVVYF